MNRNKFFSIILMLLILIWAVYHVSKVFISDKNAQENFTKEVRKVYKQAQKQYKSDAINGDSNIVYLNNIEYDDTSNARGLTIRGNSKLGFLVMFSDKGNLYYLKVEGNKYEMELGNKSDKSKNISYDDIVDSEIRNRDNNTVSNIYEEISTEVYSNFNDRGYVLENEKGDYYLTVYLGRINGDGSIKVGNIINNKGDLLVSVDTNYDMFSTSTDITTPSVKIKLKVVPSSITIIDNNNHLTFNRIENNTNIEEESIENE